MADIQIVSAGDAAFHAAVGTLVSPESFEEVTAVPGSEPRDVARKIAALVGKQDAVVFILVDLLCAGDARVRQTGIEIFKYLRLLDRFEDVTNETRTVHCVLCSFRTLEQLVRHQPASSIICAPGASFRRLPFTSGSVPFEELAKDRARLQELVRFVRADVTLPDERHSWANWYSAWQMLTVYELERPPAEHAPLGRPGAADLLFPTTSEVRDVLFAYGRPLALAGAVNQERAKLKKLRRRIRKNAGQLKVGLIDDQAQKIDGRTRFGWRRIFSRMLFDDDGGVTNVLGKLGVCPGEVNKDRLVETVLSKKDFFESYGCLLLDLRLQGPETRVTDLERLSGFQVLKRLREMHPTLPVIVTTASRRIQVYRELVRAGADAYWIKKGVEERGTADDTVSSYRSLLEYVAEALGREYQFFRRLGTEFKTLKEEDNVWWSQAAWSRDLDQVKHTLRREQINDMLQDMLLMLRQHLYHDKMRHGYKDAVSEAMSLLSIVQHGGKIIEAIHWFDRLFPAEKRNRVTIGAYWNQKTKGLEINPEHRCDWFGCYLYVRRNSASHFGSSMRWDDAAEFLTHLTCYLQHGPQNSFGEDDDPRRGPRSEIGSLINPTAGSKMVELSDAYRETAARLNR